jgi:peroxiredoxin
MRSNGMIRTTLLGLAILALAALPVLAAGAVGETAPDFSLKGVDGKTWSLAALKGKTVVLEWVNPNCPFSDRHAQEKTMSELAKQHGEVVWLGINSTSKDHPNFLQPADHQAWMQKNGVNYAVLYDETGKVGHAYDAKTTPHMFIIDKDGKIAYNGAIDDDPRGAKAKTERVNFVAGGLDAEKSGKNPNPASTTPYGCSVKYSGK